ELAGGRLLTLVVEAGDDNLDNDHADWINPVVEMADDAKPPVAVTPPSPDDPAPPIVVERDPRTAIHGPRIVGATSGRPFLYRIPATGEALKEYEAEGLPAGLRLDARAGIIRGTVKRAGEYDVRLTVRGESGVGARTLRIVAGPHRLAQTPPMGWNSWNVWAGAVDDAKVRAAADALVSSGLAAHGYQYVNIDDTWQGARGQDGALGTNARFPDMKALAEYVHAKGLKLGIYSSPGRKTCGEFEGSYGMEAIDARTWAGWGIDYVKYDWCSGESKDLTAPYRLMREALDRVDRDIVYSLCQYGMGEVWKWGASVGGNLWRTTGDITDTWHSLEEIGFGQAGHEAHAGPGRWNDPDMLVVGRVGWGPSLHPTRLTPNEQITHMTLWCLLAAPLLIGCDLAALDEFTLALLTNDEVLDVDQDSLGRTAGRVARKDRTEVWARPLRDGTLAVGLFNRGRAVARVAAEWKALGLAKPRAVRDLWLRRDLGTYEGSFSAEVPGHGAVLVKIGTSREPS
ncbi:MAG: putative Ig domain-containing protein, partial [bacterium]